MPAVMRDSAIALFGLRTRNNWRENERNGKINSLIQSDRAVSFVVEYLSDGASAFLTEDTNTPENVSAIEEYVNQGGSLDNLEVASRIASKRGNVVNYEYDTKDPEGKTESGNVVTINLASDKFIGTVAIHEALHTLGEDKTSKMYEAIKTTEWHKENADRITKQYEEAYKDRANKDSLIREEIVARYMEQAINNPRAFLKSLEGKSGIADEVIAYFKGYNKYTKNLSKADKKTLNGVYNEYLNALKEEKGEKRKISSTMYDLKKSYKEQVADYLENGTNKEYLFVDNATEQLKQLGNNDNAILVAPSVIDKAKGRHGLSDEIILKLDDMIKKPLMIMKSLTEENSLVFFSEEEVNGDNVIVAINTQSKDGFRVINKVTSFYPKQPATDFVKKSLSNILWVDKKSGQQWLRSRGLQLPNENTIDDRGYIIRKANSNVNSSTQNNTNVAENSSATKYSLPEKDYDKVLDNLDEFKSTDEIKEYFGNVHSYINEEARRKSPKTMAELNELERKRVERVIEAANLEKAALKEWRKAHRKSTALDLNTKAKIEEVDKKYRQAIADNDLDTARDLVEQMALLKGYTVTDYRMDHKAPYNNGYDARLDDVSSVFGDDIYTNNAARYFGTYEGFDNESVRHIQEAKGNPNKKVVVYRAVPKSVKGDQIRNGDWITLTYDYAKNHGESNIIGPYRIIKKTVKASEIYTDGNSIHEFGYDDGKNYYYGDTTNYRKLADVITFDDEGNPIRLRDRFNNKVDDVRYSLPETAEEDVRKHFGTTYNWNETGYITTDGRRIDFSGKNDGAPGGYRTVDHRDVADVFKGMDGNEAMIAFMARGNVRVMPETPGINVQVEPTEAQYRQIEEFISRYGWRDGYFSVDFDDANGNTVGSLEYYNHMSSRKVVDDIKKYFKDGELPHQSDLSQFRYSLRVNEGVYDEEAFADSRPGETEKKDPRSQKIYSKSEAKAIIDDALKGELERYYGLEFDGKKGELTTKLWEAFNKTPEKNKLGAAMKIAEYIVDKAVLDETDYDIKGYEAQRLKDFKDYKNAFNLNAIKKEIKYRYDTAYPAIMRQWHNGRPVEVDFYGGFDRYAQQISDEFGFNWDTVNAMNATDMFFEFLDEYEKAKEVATKKIKTEAKALFSENEYMNIVENIANKLVEGYDLKGKKDALTLQRDINAALKAEIKELSTKIRYAEAEKNVSMQIQNLTQSTKEFAKRKYSSQAFSGEEAQAVNAAFSKVVVRNKVNSDNAVAAIAVAKNFYTPERINGTTERETFGLYNQGVREDIEYLSETLESGKNLTFEQLKTLNNVMKAVTHVFRSIDTIIYDGKRRHTAEVASTAIAEQRALPKPGKKNRKSKAECLALDFRRGYKNYLFSSDFFFLNEKREREFAGSISPAFVRAIFVATGPTSSYISVAQRTTVEICVPREGISARTICAIPIATPACGRRVSPRYF